MDFYIEKELSKFQTHTIDYAAIKSILKKLGYENINDKIIGLKQKGIISSLKKGLYIHNPLILSNILSKEIISNNLLNAPSYISLDYALNFYGLIPETVHEITAVTTNRSKIFRTEFGIFSYKQIKKELFQLGLIIESSQNGNFLIASKEKALCDKIYLTKNIEINSTANLNVFLNDDLRIDLDEIKGLNIGIISEYYEISKSKKIKILLNLIKKL